MSAVFPKTKIKDENFKLKIETFLLNGRMVTTFSTLFRRPTKSEIYSFLRDNTIVLLQSYNCYKRGNSIDNEGNSTGIGFVVYLKNAIRLYRYIIYESIQLVTMSA